MVYARIGEQNLSTQNVSLWHMDYFELKTIKAQRTQEESLIFPPNCLSEVKWSESHSVVSDSLRPYGLNSPWNSPGKNTWVASSQPRDQTQVSRIALQAYSLPAEPQGKPSIKMILNFIESIQHTAWHTETFIVDTGGDITYCYYFCGLMFSANPQFSSILSFQLPRYKTTSNHYYGEGNGNPLQYSCLENPMDRGAWWSTVPEVPKSQTQLSD